VSVEFGQLLPCVQHVAELPPPGYPSANADWVKGEEMSNAPNNALQTTAVSSVR
jgi:hypothetical protein